MSDFTQSMIQATLIRLPFSSMTTNFRIIQANIEKEKRVGAETRAVMERADADAQSTLHYCPGFLP